MNPTPIEVLTNVDHHIPCIGGISFSQSRNLAAWFVAASLLALTLPSLPATPAATERDILTTVAALRNATDWNIRNPRPMRLVGTVTFVDHGRELIFLQDETAGVALRIPNPRSDLQPGATVEIKSSGVLPCPPILSAYPLAPADREILPSFSVSGREGTRYVDRFRALLTPPVTGEYVFWIASDDSSELWLSEDSDPAHAQRIASAGRWTEPDEWTRLPSQRSEARFLTASRACYIEAIREQNLGAAHLSVAWQGPGFARSVISGDCLEPFGMVATREGNREAAKTGAPGQASHPPVHTPGVAREIWNDCAVRDVAALNSSLNDAQVFQPQDATITVIESHGSLPPPLALATETFVLPRDAYCWTEIRGTVRFASRGADSLHLDIDVENLAVPLPVTVSGWPHQRPPPERGALVRARGVCEPAQNADAAWVVGRLLVSHSDELDLVSPSPQWDAIPRVELSALTSGRASLADDRLIKVRGTVVAQDGSWTTLRDPGTFRAYASTDGEHWTQIGPEISIAMSDTPHAGLAITSLSDEVVAEADFSHVSGLPEALQGVEIGIPGLHGKVAAADGRISIAGTGSEIWSFSDRFFFAQQRIHGNAEIVVRLERFTAPAPESKAGIMIRDNLSPESHFVDLVAVGNVGPSLQWRREGPGGRGNRVETVPMPLPYWLKLIRHYNTTRIQCAESTLALIGSTVEAVGYLSPDASAPAIIEARLREVSAHNLLPATSSTPRPLLSVKDLLAAQEERLPDTLMIRGTATFAGRVGTHYYLALQDPTAGSFIPVGDADARIAVQPGHLLEIEFDPVEISGVLRAKKIVDLGPGRFPAPVQHPLDYALLRKGEGHWLELEGVVRTVDEAGVASIGSSTEVFLSYISDFSPGNWRELIDARVRLRGVLSYRDPANRLVLTPGPAHLSIIERPPSLDTMSPAPIAAAFGRDSFSTPLHRVKIAGSVTLAADQMIYVQDDSGGAIIHLENGVAARGDRIEVVGFPDPVRSHLRTLRHALITKSDRNAEPPAVPATMPELLQGTYSGMLVRLEAMALGPPEANDGRALELQAGGRKFRARLTAGDSRKFSPVPDGTKVAITGVCISDASLAGWIGQAPADSSVAPFELHTRSADDVIVLEHPSWWRIKRALHAVGVLTAGLFFTFGWVHILRRRVKQRNRELGIAMANLQRETIRSATLAERNRVAGEMHDSLEQGLSGLLLQLDATAEQPSCPTEVRDGLMLAKRMASFSRTELHHAIWDMESDVLENADLATAIKRIAEQFGAGSPRIVYAVEGTPYRLTSLHDHNLLRIAQEAITNARKHAAANTIHVTLTYSANTVVLRVQDDGKGFSPDRILTGRPGHFGLRSLRSRARRIDGNLSISSAETGGTLIELKLSFAPSVLTTPDAP